MARHFSHTAGYSEYESFDLSDIFIGREQHLDLFELYLNRWKTLMFNSVLDDALITTPPSPYNKIQSLVVLLYGCGGFGKSTLLRRYHDISLQENRNFAVGNIVDWEFAIEGKRSLFNPPPGQEIDATEYYKVLCGQLASTTLLVSPGTEGFDLLGVAKPENEILEQPEQHLPMHGRQRASCHRGGEKPLQEAEAALIGTA
jgi:hypothetical protein